jgi:hypothetical protein
MSEHGSERAGSSNPDGHRPSAPLRFDLQGAPAAPEAPRVTPPTPLFAGSIALLLVGFAFVRGLVLEGSVLAVSLSLAAAAFRLRTRRLVLPAAPARALVLGDPSLTLETPGASTLVLLDVTRPFGLTLLTNAARDRLVAAFTAENKVFFVGANLERGEREAASALLARASAVPAEGAGLEAFGPDGAPVDLAFETFATLLRALETRAPACASRLYLSDGWGSPIRVDGGELRLGTTRFELARPIEWSAFVFQERLGGAIAIYQATWLKQGSAEAVLVALLPSLVAEQSAPRPTGIAELDRAAARDRRLSSARVADAPPRSQRVAVDRLFMVPLRAALDRAPGRSRGVRARARGIGSA